MKQNSCVVLFGVLGLVFFVIGCGAGIENGDDSILVVNTKSLPADGVLKLRWFPVGDATGYRLYAENTSGNVVQDEQVVPSKCTHAILDGYTSGVCELEYDVRVLPEESVVRIRAYNQDGESAPSIEVSY